MASFLVLQIPAGLAGAVLGIPIGVLLGGPAGLACGAVAAAATLTAEAVALLYFCGLRFESLDLSLDLPAA